MSFIVEGPGPGPDALAPAPTTCSSTALAGNGCLHAAAPPGETVPVRVLTGQRPARAWAGPRRPRGGAPGGGGPYPFTSPPIDQAPQ